MLAAAIQASAPSKANKPRDCHAEQGDWLVKQQEKEKMVSALMYPLGLRLSY